MPVVTVHQVSGMLVPGSTTRLLRNRATNVPRVRARMNFGTREQPNFGDVNIYAGGGRATTLDTQVAQLEAFLAELLAFPTLLARFVSYKETDRSYKRASGETVHEKAYETNLDRLEFHSLAKRTWVKTAQEANEGRRELGARQAIVPAAQNVPTHLPPIAAQATPELSNEALLAIMAERFPGMSVPVAAPASAADKPW
jgi:hypothetical protein